MADQPAARWTLDCQGKQDYDGPLLDISTRYWPPGHASTGVATAHTAINVRYAGSDPDEPEYRAWREEHFSAPTEAEVKVLVERWVADRYAEVLALLGPAMTATTSLRQALGLDG